MQSKGYPSKTRNVALGKPFPGRKRDIRVGRAVMGGPSPRGAHDMGKPPRKGVLRRGGGHG